MNLYMNNGRKIAINIRVPKEEEVEHDGMVVQSYSTPTLSDVQLRKMAQSPESHIQSNPLCHFKTNVIIPINYLFRETIIVEEFQ